MTINNTDFITYKSTRGQSKELYFKDAIFEGLATDGGLYVPSSWPKLDSRSYYKFLKKCHIKKLHSRSLNRYIDNTLSDQKLQRDNYWGIQLFYK